MARGANVARLEFYSYKNKKKVARLRAKKGCKARVLSSAIL
jgi:hypothetical protein